MFEKITPEEAGVSSKQVAEYISYLNRRGAVMHSVLMMRHGKIFAEYYWAPFHKDFLHHSAEGSRCNRGSILLQQSTCALYACG
jgi:hypothetical protein